MSNNHPGSGTDGQDNMDLAGTGGSLLGRAKPQGEIKASELVLAAIHHLKEAKGSTPKEIMDYISQEYNCNSTQLKRSVQTALKRGVQFGILRHENGHYMVEPVEDENLLMVAKARGHVGGGVTSLRRCGRKRPKKRGCRRKKRKCRSRRRKRKCGRRRRRSSSRRRCGKKRRRSRKRCGRKRRRSARRCGKPRRCYGDDDNELKLS